MSDDVDFDDYTDSYDRLLQYGTGFFSSNDRYFAQYKVDIVRKQMLAPVGRLLEYGCGIGRNISFLQKAFPDAVIVGSDVSRASLEIARRNNEGVEFFQEGVAVEASSPFDVIFVAGVFHHVPVVQRVGVATALRERLSENGSLFVFEHNPFNPVTRRIVSQCPYDKGTVLISPFELKYLLAKSGWAVERTAYCLFVPPKLSLLARLESRLGWLPLGGQYWVHATPAI